MDVKDTKKTKPSSDYHLPVSKIESIDLDRFERPGDDKGTSQHDRIIRLLGRALGSGVVIVGGDGPKTINNVSMTPDERQIFKDGLTKSEIRVRARLAQSRGRAGAK
jgi:hypothetical protein